jgi:hypothetical protein
VILLEAVRFETADFPNLSENLFLAVLKFKKIFFLRKWRGSDHTLKFLRIFFSFFFRKKKSKKYFAKKKARK